MTRATTLTMLLAAGYLAAVAWPAPTAAQAPAGAQAQGTPQRQGQPPATAACGRGRGNAPEGRCTDEARAASNMFLLRPTAESRA